MPVPITESGSTPPASRITESTGSPELVDERLSLGGYGRFGSNELPSLLSEVDEIMAAAGCAPVHLVTVGGASMLTRIPGRQTGDIDIISEGMNNDLREACKEVASRHNLAPDWMNDGVKGFTVSVDLQPERIFTGKCLTLDSAGPRYLLAMKLLSGRKADEQDCIHLIRETGIYDEEELLDLMETASGVRGLRPRDEYWAKEMLAVARKGRRIRSLRNSFLALVRRLTRSRTADKPESGQAALRKCGAPNKSKAGHCSHPHPGKGGRCPAGHQH